MFQAGCNQCTATDVKHAALHGSEFLSITSRPCTDSKISSAEALARHAERKNERKVLLLNGFLSKVLRLLSPTTGKHQGLSGYHAADPTSNELYVC